MEHTAYTPGMNATITHVRVVASPVVVIGAYDLRCTRYDGRTDTETVYVRPGDFCDTFLGHDGPTCYCGDSWCRGCNDDGGSPA